MKHIVEYKPYQMKTWEHKFFNGGRCQDIILPLVSCNAS